MALNYKDLREALTEFDRVAFEGRTEGWDDNPDGERRLVPMPARASTLSVPSCWSRPRNCMRDCLPGYHGDLIATPEISPRMQLLPILPHPTSGWRTTNRPRRMPAPR